MVLMLLRKHSQFLILLILTLFFSQYVLAAVNCCMQGYDLQGTRHATQDNEHVVNSQWSEATEMPCHSEIQQSKTDDHLPHDNHSDLTKDECCDNDCGCVNGTVSSVYLTSDLNGFSSDLNHQSQYLYSLDTLTPIQHALFKPPILAAA